MLEAFRITHRYGNLPAVLSEVSFTYPRDNGILALVGPSGSGKTTMLGIIGGLIEPSDGGRISAGEAGEQMTPTWVFQTPNILPHRTAVENAALGALAAGKRWTAAVRAADAALEAYGLTHAANSKARSLSGGEIQRLVLARAELFGTRWLLADEPTGQLDRANTVMVAAALRKVADAGTTVIVATHDPDVEAAADAVVHLKDARADYVDRA